jgi:hypothetical protein
MADEITMALVSTTLRTLRIYEIYPANWINSNFFKQLCGALVDICKMMDLILADANPDLNDGVAIQNYVAHYPSGSSLKQMEHITQLVRAQRFLKFDYGPIGNLGKYG